jgi:type IV secretory pathway TrbD component
MRLNQSLVRPLLVAGAERKPAGVTIGCGLGMLACAWQFVSWPCAVVGLLFLCVVLPVLQTIAKRDPQMFDVYRRYISAYPQSFYPARPSAFGRR